MREAVVLAACACVSFFLCFGSHCDTTGYEMPHIDKQQLKRAEEYIEKGVHYFEKKAYKMALAEFQGAVDISPQFFNARYNIARTYLAMKRTKDAVAQLEMINADFKDNIVAYNMLGQIYVVTGREDKVMKLFETAVANGEKLLNKVELPQAKVDIAMAYHNLASVQIDNGELESAEDNLRKSVEANDSNYFSHYALGALLVKTGKLQEAREELHRARELNAWFVATDIELARANLLGNPPSVMHAVSILREAKRKDPNNPEIYELLGNCYMVRKKTSEEARLNDYAEAIGYYRDALNLDKDNPRYMVLLARASALAGENDTARKVLENLRKKKIDLPAKTVKEMHLVEAHIFKEKKEWARAAEEYKQAFEIDSKDYAACLEAGKCYYEAKNLQEAEIYLEKALKPFGENTPPDLAEKLDEARQMLLEIRNPQ